MGDAVVAVMTTAEEEMAEDDADNDEEPAVEAEITTGPDGGVFLIA